MILTADELCLFPRCVSIVENFILHGTLFCTRKYAYQGLKPCVCWYGTKKEKEEYSFGMRTSKSKEVKELDSL